MKEKLNERLNGKVSYDEWRKTYDMDDPEQFGQQAKQFNNWERIMMLLSICFETWDVNNWKDFHGKLNEITSEVEHFKAYLQEKTSNHNASIEELDNVAV